MGTRGARKLSHLTASILRPQVRKSFHVTNVSPFPMRLSWDARTVLTDDLLATSYAQFGGHPAPAKESSQLSVRSSASGNHRGRKAREEER